jgi:metallo-beta-lactamase family protein
MKLTFFGAAGGNVTGSCCLVESAGRRLLVDCGQFQGGRRQESLNRLPAAIQAARLDAVLLTHAHLDHCGRLPLLLRAGFKGPIFATPASIDLAGLILRDSAKIQAHDNERLNRKRERAGQDPLPPLFTLEDVERVLALFRPLAYDQPHQILPGLTLRAIEAGHMLGSASLQLTADEGGRQRVVVFSGDIGPLGLPVLRDPECFDRADAVVMESTYGDRDHKPLGATLTELKGILHEAAAARSRLLVPAFAVGRTQQIVYHLLEMFSKGEIAPFPIHIDSPMAQGANRIYQHHPELYDEEARQLGRTLQERPELLRHVKETESVEDSIALNRARGPCLILAGAGMCNAGRILHHLKHGLWQPHTHVLIVGFQAHGTLGRLLVDGVSPVKIFGEPIAVRAKVHTLNGFSAHAGQSGLLKWFGCLAASRPKVFLNHGEDRPREALAAKLRELHRCEVILPALGESVEIA